MVNLAQGDATALARLGTPVRNRYFYGKLLDQFHLDMEQSYFNRKRWLLNRLIAGGGVVCGLGLRVPDDPPGRVVIDAGVAIDALGREIVVPAATPPVDPRQPTDAWGRPAGDRIEGEGTVTLCLAYHECAADPVPVLVAECETEQVCEPSAVRERYTVLVRAGAPPAIAPACGLPDLFTPSGEGGGLPNIHPRLAQRVSQACPEVTGDTCVVLARVDLPAADQALTADMIDLAARPIVPSNDLLLELLLCVAAQAGGAAPAPPPEPAPPLTRITAVSWGHDGGMALATFIDRGLTVTFSGNVTAIAANNRGWFIVALEYPVRTDEAPDNSILPGTIVVQRVLDAGISVASNQAFFQPDARLQDLFTFTRIRDLARADQVLCRVVLKCDFLIGEDGRPVDGNHLGGNLPSGDGVPGGDFESWFLLS